MDNHYSLIEKWKKDKAFKKAYDALEDEFALFDEMAKARKAVGLTQAEVAKRMGTKAPAIARLESVSSRAKSSPSLNTLRQYAKAIGCRLQIRLILSHPN